MITEQDCQHHFEPLGSAYFKQTGQIGGLGLPIYDQSKSYQRLYCPRCGETKEVLQFDGTQRTPSDFVDGRKP